MTNVEQILKILATSEKSLAKIASLMSPPLSEHQTHRVLFELRQTGQVQLINYDTDIVGYPLMYRLTDPATKPSRNAKGLA
jgi:hypothetical protein